MGTQTAAAAPAVTHETFLQRLEDLCADFKIFAALSEKYLPLGIAVAEGVETASGNVALVPLTAEAGAVAEGAAGIQNATTVTAAITGVESAVAGVRALVKGTPVPPAAS